jgi:3-oxoacyl-[acyl-carrier protein] reductase
MIIDFNNKDILISGATGNLGKSMVNFFSKYNSCIHATSTNYNFVKKFNNFKKKNKNIKYYYLDFTNDESVNNFLKEIKKLSKIDILINNAGINKIDYIQKIKISDWKEIQKVNLTGPYILTKEISKTMIKRRKGNILNISSIFGSVGKEKRSSYSSSKWGLIGLTKSSSLDLAKYNIIVNSLSPGVIASELSNNILGKKGINNIIKLIPMNRLAQRQEVVKVIAFLVSSQNSYITGQNIIVDGGYTCG